MEKLIIDRGEWLTGTASWILDATKLREPQTGLMCCLGFYGQQHCDLTPDQMNDKTMLGTLKAAPSWMYATCTDRGIGRDEKVESALASVNDSDLHPTRKESRIKKLFKKYGDVEVVFKGRYADATKKARRAVR